MLRRISPLLTALIAGIAIGITVLGGARAHTVTKSDCVRYARGHHDQLTAFRKCSAWAKQHNELERLKKLPATPLYASWYGPGFYGNGMACPGAGPLLETSMVVAHRTLPCGTSLLICYRRCAIATVEDRGPYVSGRDLDLAGAVKTRIGFQSVGTVTVRGIRA